MSEARPFKAALPRVLPDRLRTRLSPRDPRVRPRLWTELALVVVAYGLYSLTRDAVPGQRAAAMRRAESVLRTEHSLHVDVELTINHALDKITPLIVGMNYYYATLHFLITIGVLVWLYVRHPQPPRHLLQRRRVDAVLRDDGAGPQVVVVGAVGADGEAAPAERVGDLAHEPRRTPGDEDRGDARRLQRREGGDRAWRDASVVADQGAVQIAGDQRGREYRCHADIVLEAS